ncbi:protein Aster-B isoform X1 [Stomoxys calcitrans]|uniref:protein Aster-B isoform X1 n=1 Tax=Stomoxys calcitrans TaxID=35570 RepID=UPI0027E331CB|nr:protein Aster-B isoform X1 [Stomoxys calcitrans]
MNCSEYCNTSKTSNKISKEDTTTSNHLTCQATAEGGVKKTNFPNTFITPQNCFDILTSTSNKVFTASADGSHILFKSMKNLLPEDYAKETYSVAGSINSEKPTSSCQIIKETSDSSICSYYFSVPSKNTDLNTLTNYSKNLCETKSFNADLEIDKILQEDPNIDCSFTNKPSSTISSASAFHGEEDSPNPQNENTIDTLCGNNLLDTSTLRTDKTRNVLRLSDRAKKKSWYNVLYPNYKSRSQEFKRLFKEIPVNERLIVDYSCALYRDLLLQGRLYISQNYVCFHANILGWETCLIIKWKEVTSITKEKTALVIPNAISISTPTESHFFSSFTTRDKTFLILFRVWQNSLMNKPMLAQEVWQLVHSYYGDELGLTTDDEDYVDPRPTDNDSCTILDFVSAIDETQSLSIDNPETSDIYIFHAFSNNSNSSNYSSSSGGASSKYPSNRERIMKSNAKELTLNTAKPDEGVATSTPIPSTNATGNGVDHYTDRAASSTPAKEARHSSASNEGKRKVAKNIRIREENAMKNVETLPTDISDSSDSEGTNIPFVATTECSSLHEGRQLVHTILPINIETLFNLLFSKSKFLLDFHAVRKSSDLVFGDWIRDEEGQRTRTVNLTVQLAASVGPKTSKVTEYQAMRECSKQGELYSIDVNSVNAGIPYADSFSVLIHYCLVKTVDDHTMLSIHAQIKYKKSIWGVVKGFIEKNTWAGLEDFYGSLLQSLQNETCIPPAKGKGRRPRRGTGVQPRPQEDLPPQQAKPEPLEHFIGAQTVNSRSIADSSTVVVDTTNKYRWLSLFVLVLLCFLIIVNVILLLKLWKLEERLEEDLLNRARLPNLAALKTLPNNHEDWIELMRQQELLHETEMRKWHTVLQTAIELLKKVSNVCQDILPKDNIKQQINRISDEF